MPLRVLHFFNVFTVEKRICRVSQCVIVGVFYRILSGSTWLYKVCYKGFTRFFEDTYEVLAFLPGFTWLFCVFNIQSFTGSNRVPKKFQQVLYGLYRVS